MKKLFICLILCHSPLLFSCQELPTIEVKYLSELTGTVQKPGYKPLEPHTIVKCITNGEVYAVNKDVGGDSDMHTVWLRKKGANWNRSWMYDVYEFTYYNDGEKQETNGVPSAGLRKTNQPAKTFEFYTQSAVCGQVGLVGAFLCFKACCS